MTSSRVVQLLVTAAALGCAGVPEAGLDPADAGGVDPGTADAATEVPDAGPPDGVDAGTPSALEDAGGGDAGAMPQRDAGPATADAGSRADAGPPGAPDAGRGASRCVGSGLRLCDGFESGAIDPSVWSTAVDPGANNSVSVATTRAARGTHALHVTASGAAGTDVLLKTSRGFPYPGNAFWGRAFVYVEGALPTCNWNFITGSGAGATYDLAGQGEPFCSATGKKIFRFHYSPGDLAKKSTAVIPTDRWACWEWFFRGDELRAWVDGQELDMAVVGGWAAPQFSQLTVGLHHAHPEPLSRYELWFDEVALDPSRIGCDR